MKDQSAQTAARLVSIAYCLWLAFFINRVLKLKVKEHKKHVMAVM